jgi:branched-chain amino acid transport system ATP-binding protein
LVNIDRSRSPLPPPVLEVCDLGVRYGALVALQEVSWSVGAGELLGIIGPNGAGKSSCYDAVTALVPRVGRVMLAGEDVTAVAPHRLAERGLKRAFQHNAFFDDLSVIDNYMAVLGARAHPRLAGSLFRPWAAARLGSQAREFATAQLVRFGVAPEYHAMPARQLPYGVSRLLSIALAYGAGCRVLLLDEPAAGLGGEDLSRLAQLLARLKSDGAALVVIEHHMELIMAVADRLCVLDLGRRIAYDTPQAVQRDERVLKAYLGAAV